MPAFEQAAAEGIPTIAYDVPVDFADTLFISFDNVAVGRLMAEAMVEAQPSGNWVLIEGDPMMSIVDLFRQGQMQVVQPLVDKGDDRRSWPSRASRTGSPTSRRRRWTRS